MMNLVIPKHLITACMFFTCTALAGYADRFGNLTYVEYDTYIEITDYLHFVIADVVIPNEIVGKPVTSIGEQAFLSAKLTSVTIPASVTNIGNSAFKDCTSLTSITIPDSVASIGELAFTRCTNLTAITVNAANSAYSSIDGVLFDKNQTMLIQYPPNKAGPYTIPDSVTTIEESAFEYCNGLTSITIGSGVTTIGTKAFLGAYGLTSVIIPDSVTFIGASAFTHCNLTNVMIGSGVTNIGSGTFAYCGNLTNVTIPDSVTIIEEAAFYACQNMTSVTIGSGVTSIGNSAFEFCTRLTSMTIPDSVISIGQEAFYKCHDLTSLTIGNGVTSIGREAFFECRDLTTVTIPDSVTSIGQAAFDMCTRLTNLTIGSGVTIIEQEVFSRCHSLTDVTIPDNVTAIREKAFGDCSNLTMVYFKGNAPSHYQSVFWLSDNVTIYYLVGTTGWEATFAGRPTRLTIGTLDPLIGGLDLAEVESWFVSGWFGAYSTALAPWIYHAEHGFLYRYPESTNANTYFYDDTMGAWWWTTSDFFPAIYGFDPPVDNAGVDIDSEWLWYEKYTRDPRSFGVLTGDLAGTTLYYGP